VCMLGMILSLRGWRVWLEILLVFMPVDSSDTGSDFTRIRAFSKR
jgi:hypothetical protein